MAASDVAEVVAIDSLCEAALWSADMYGPFAAGKEGRGAWVCEVGGEVAGFLCAHRVLDEAELLNLAVRRESRGLGLASKLVGCMIRWAAASGIVRIHLEVRAGNAAAQALYRKFRFERVGTRRGYYAPQGEDALLYTLNLTP